MLNGGHNRQLQITFSWSCPIRDQLPDSWREWWPPWSASQTQTVIPHPECLRAASARPDRPWRGPDPGSGRGIPTRKGQPAPWLRRYPCPEWRGGNKNKNSVKQKKGSSFRHECAFSRLQRTVDCSSGTLRYHVWNKNAASESEPYHLILSFTPDTKYCIGTGTSTIFSSLKYRPNSVERIHL